MPGSDAVFQSRPPQVGFCQGCRTFEVRLNEVSRDRWRCDACTVQEVCPHVWIKVPEAEPPYDVCNRCGLKRE